MPTGTLKRHCECGGKCDECKRKPRKFCQRPRRPSAFSEANGVGRVEAAELFRSGFHRGKKYPERGIQQMADNFAKFSQPENGKSPLVSIPAVIGHEEDQQQLKDTGIPAAGWVENVWTQRQKCPVCAGHGTVEKDGAREPCPDCDGKGTVLYLLGDVGDVAPAIADAIEHKRYRTTSAEVYDEPPEKVPGKGMMLRRVAWLGGELPQIKDLKDIPKPKYSERGASYRTVPLWRCSGGKCDSGSGAYTVFFECGQMQTRKFCQATRKPGPCAGQKRGVSAAQHHGAQATRHENAAGTLRKIAAHHLKAGNHIAADRAEGEAATHDASAKQHRGFEAKAKPRASAKAAAAVAGRKPLLSTSRAGQSRINAALASNLKKGGAKKGTALEGRKAVRQDAQTTPNRVLGVQTREKTGKGAGSRALPINKKASSFMPKHAESANAFCAATGKPGMCAGPSAGSGLHHGTATGQGTTTRSGNAVMQTARRARFAKSIGQAGNYVPAKFAQRHKFLEASEAFSEIAAIEHRWN